MQPKTKRTQNCPFDGGGWFLFTYVVVIEYATLDRLNGIDAHRFGTRPRRMGALNARTSTPTHIHSDTAIMVNRAERAHAMIAFL